MSKVGRSAERTNYDAKKAHPRLYVDSSRGRPINLTREEMEDVRDYVDKHLRSPRSYPLLRFCKDHNISRSVLNKVKGRMESYEEAFGSRPLENPRQPWSWHKDQEPTPDHLAACKEWKVPVMQHRDQDVHPDKIDPSKPPKPPTEMTIESAHKEMGRIANIENPTGEEINRMEVLERYIRTGRYVGSGEELGPPPPQTRAQWKKRLMRLCDCTTERWGLELWKEVMDEFRGGK